MQTPYWLLEERLLKNNLELLEYIKDKTGVKILLALKGYPCGRVSIWYLNI